MGGIFKALGRGVWWFVRRLLVSRLAWGLGLSVLIAALALPRLFPPPIATEVRDVCLMMDTRPGWWRAVRAAEARWNTPAHLQLAIMRSESTFRRFAHPPRMPPPLARSIRGVYGAIDSSLGTSLRDSLSWPTIATAYGYPQAINATWARYKDAADAPLAMRIRFRDGTDFIAWYAATLQNSFDIGWDQACDMHLAYITGRRAACPSVNASQAAPSQSTADVIYIAAARRTAQYAQAYARQLERCGARLDADSRWWVWPQVQMGLREPAN